MQTILEASKIVLRRSTSPQSLAVLWSLAGSIHSRLCHGTLTTWPQQHHANIISHTPARRLYSYGTLTANTALLTHQLVEQYYVGFPFHGRHNLWPMWPPTSLGRPNPGTDSGRRGLICARSKLDSGTDSGRRTLICARFRPAIISQQVTNVFAGAGDCHNLHFRHIRPRHLHGSDHPLATHVATGRA